MNTHKHTERDSAPTKLVKTDSQTENAFIMFSCIFGAGILLVVTIIAEHL